MRIVASGYSARKDELRPFPNRGRTPKATLSRKQKPTPKWRLRRRVRKNPRRLALHRSRLREEKEKSDWDVVPVFYGTDRDHEANPKRLAYNADRAHRLELGRAFVTVPKIHQVPEIERPWAIRIPYFDVTIYEQAEDPKKHFTLQEIKALTKADFLRLVRAQLAASNSFKNHALVFVHGYDTSFDNALYRTAQIAYDLHFDGAPFLYSWPSGGAVTSYTYDRESAEGSEPYLRQFLDVVVKETGAKSISVIAHSMGNKPLLDVLRDMKAAAPKGVVVSELILAAPDVDADNFTNLAQQIRGLAKGVTLYAAANDRALLASRNFWGHYRAGDVPATGPLVVLGVDSIDVSAASTDVFALNHSDYAQNNDLMTDIAKLITTGQRPPDRRFDKLKPVNAGKRVLALRTGRAADRNRYALNDAITSPKDDLYVSRQKAELLTEKACDPVSYNRLRRRRSSKTRGSSLSGAWAIRWTSTRAGSCSMFMRVTPVTHRIMSPEGIAYRRQQACKAAGQPKRSPRRPLLSLRERTLSG